MYIFPFWMDFFTRMYSHFHLPMLSCLYMFSYFRQSFVMMNIDHYTRVWPSNILRALWGMWSCFFFHQVAPDCRVCVSLASISPLTVFLATFNSHYHAVSIFHRPSLPILFIVLLLICYIHGNRIRDPLQVGIK